MGMPTSALSAVADTATSSDRRRAERLSGLMMRFLNAGVVCHARRRGLPRSARAPARRVVRPGGSVLAHHDVGGLADRVGGVAHLEPAPVSARRPVAAVSAHTRA